MSESDDKTVKIPLSKPVTITSIEIAKELMLPTLKEPFMGSYEQGSWASVRLVSQDPNEPTRLGIYLGDMSGPSFAIKTKKDAPEDPGTLVVTPGFPPNPCLYVPRLNRLVYGMECWWGTISSPEDLKVITDEDIDSQWYMQALRSLSEKRRQKLDA